MNPARATPRPSTRHRQIGRKVLLADRLSRAMNDTKHKEAKYHWPFRPIRPRVIALLCLAAMGIGILGIGGAQFYFAKVATTQKAAAAKRQSKLAAKSLAADACRRQKAQQKADQIGKITYDELYDYGECDK